MKCSNCGREVADVKKTCPYCGKFLTGFTVNNVTGEYGYRDENGNFTPYFKFEKKESKWRKLGKLLANHWKAAIVVLASGGVAAWVYVEPMRLVKALFALLIWLAFIFFATISFEIYKYMRDELRD